MNRREIRDDIRENLGETDPAVVMDPDDSDYDPDQSGDMWKDTLINRNIDKAIRKFCRSERWDWLWVVQGNIAVPAGNPSIEFINDVPTSRHGMLTLAENGTDRVFTPAKVSPGEGIRYQAEGYRRGREPEFWFAARTVDNSYDDDPIEKAMVITVVPTPVVDYVAAYHFLMDPAPLADDDTEPLLPDVYHDAIVAYATMLCFLKEMNSGKAAEQLTIYEGILEDARRDLRKNATDEVVRWGRSVAPRRERRIDRLGGPLGH